MRINRLELNNFRNFEYATFEFPTNFTVIIGENGKGKSSILQGLRLAAGTFLLGIDEADRYHILKEDIRRIDLHNRFVPQKNCFFSAFGLIGDQEIHWKRSIAKPGGRTDIKEAYALIDRAKELNDAVNEHMREDIDLPVIGFFSTARLWVEPKQTINLKKKGSRLRDGYSRCLGDHSDKKSPMEWIKSASWKKLKERPESVLLDAVLEAIDICVQNWKPTEWDEDSDDLGGQFTNDRDEKNFLPLFYLSDGLRTMAAMVAEIAYRCVILNAHLGREAVKLSKGIVLIDELDMHIHPKWQQHVVSDLKQAFPNIQFIATTHSPFIVQSLKAEELINLDTSINDDPYKMSIQDVSSRIMKVEPRSLEYKQKFDLTLEYLNLLSHIKDNKKEMSMEFKYQLDEMEKSAEINDPAVAAFLKMNRLAVIGKTDIENTK
ncbi:AAA family ATPase [Lunatimonas salinarum]|uniref:AAA family ATPase n=1 Tax=Lunatimonas salinarum TaxID=1774590 RepID=UPI001ADF7BE6|nr:AAA family ATPase [Lunatimonas salinarum]